MRQDIKDHSGRPISALDMLQCLESYRAGDPPSRLQNAFPLWKWTRAEGSLITLGLSQPDAYLARNLSSLRYFRIQGQKKPCSEPTQVPADGEPKWIGSGPYLFPTELGFSSSGPFHFKPITGTGPTFVFVVVRDELQRLMALLRGEIDLAPNALSLTRTRWLVEKHPDRFSLVERPGVNVSYIAFNLRDPILADLRVRKALAHAIPRQDFVDYKMAKFGTLAGSLISPLLPEGFSISFSEDLLAANRLLDEAGRIRDATGKRFSLKYRTTPVREGMETALVLKESWGKLGIQLELDIVEPAAFLTAVRKGAFQVYSSRWVGVADGSILHRTMRSGSLNNRVHFKDIEADRLLDRLMSTTALEERLPDARALQILMMEQLPYFPLWHWGNAVIVSKQTGLKVKSSDVSLSGAYEPLLRAVAAQSVVPLEKGL